MGRRVEEEENHWPGFVDALSTIIMVVTFLLIILGISIFVLSQKITEEKVVEAVTEALGKENKIKEELETEISKLQSQVAKLSGNSRLSTSDGRATSLRQSTDVDGTDEILVSSRNYDDELLVNLPNERIEQPQDDGVEITQTAAFLTLEFDANLVGLTDDVTESIDAFVDKYRNDLANKKLEIQSIAASDVASVSEAKRVAYYRAIAVRNALLSNGIDSELITSRIRPDTEDSTSNRVYVIIK